MSDEKRFHPSAAGRTSPGRREVQKKPTPGLPLPPVSRPVEAGIPLPLHEQDPYELVGVVVPGDARQTEAMARAFIEEFILLGWNQKQLMSLFTSPLYLGTFRIYREKGEAWVRSLIEDLWAQWCGEASMGGHPPNRIVCPPGQPQDPQEEQ